MIDHDPFDAGFLPIHEHTTSLTQYQFMAIFLLTPTCIKRDLRNITVHSRTNKPPASHGHLSGFGCVEMIDSRIFLLPNLVTDFSITVVRLL